MSIHQTGYVRRYAREGGRRGWAEERFVLVWGGVALDRDLDLALGSDTRWELLDQCFFDASQSPLGPALVYDKIWRPTISHAEWVERVFTGAVASSDEQVGFPADDFRMSDDEFWALIDLISPRGGSVRSLVAQLERLSDQQVAGFYRVLAEKLHALDHPDNTVRTPETSDGLVSADLSLYYRAGIIASGKDVFTDYLSHPRLMRTGAELECEELLFVAQEAKGIEFTSLIDIETGANGELWGARPEGMILDTEQTYAPDTGDEYDEWRALTAEESLALPGPFHGGISSELALRDGAALGVYPGIYSARSALRRTDGAVHEVLNILRASSRESAEEIATSHFDRIAQERGLQRIAPIEVEDLETDKLIVDTFPLFRLSAKTAQPAQLHRRYC